jgi:cytochrome c556
LVPLFLVNLTAQTPPAKAPAAAKTGPSQPANLGQLMKGVLYINSNVIFAAQSTNPNDVKQAKDSSVAVNALESAYGKWEAVENSSLAIAEAASLLTLPGRKCANGRDVPIRNADWPKFVQGVREAGMTAYRAAKAKDQDKILDAAEVITNACAACHDKYREVADRCK